MTSADEELERAKKLAEDKVKKRLADKIVKMADEEFFPSRLRNCIWVLRITCIVADVVCFPLFGWLYTQWANSGVSFNTIAVLLPLVFLGFITAVVTFMKIPE